MKHRKWCRTKVALGWTLDYSDRFVLRHRFYRVCCLSYDLLNDCEACAKEYD